MRLGPFAIARCAGVLLTLLVAGCAVQPPRRTAAPPPPPSPRAEIRVDVVRNGDSWIAEFSFDRRSPVWVFPRSALTAEDKKPWRPRSWAVETPGVRLERVGSYDALVADGEVPINVRVRFTPFSGRLLADYAPALVFTDGSVALYSHHFASFPMASEREVKQLPSDINKTPIPDSRTHMYFRDALGEVWHDGKRVDIAQLTDEERAATYLLFGRIQPIVTNDMVAFLDPKLPSWIQTALSRAVPDLLARYTRWLGEVKGSNPAVLVAWAGPTPGLISKGGSVLKGLIAMTYEGAGLLQESAWQRGEGLWFIAHEAAHFWLGQTVGYEYARDAWITEGGADLLALRTVAAIDPEYDWRVEMNRSIADCVQLTEKRGVANARDRNEHRAYYACGAVFGLVAEASSKKPFFEFVRGLLDDNRADAMVTRAEWLAALDRASRNPALSRDVAQLLDYGADKPAEFIAAMFERAGVRFRRGAQGAIEIP